VSGEDKEGEKSPASRAGARDWPVYNRDVSGGTDHPISFVSHSGFAGRSDKPSE
jgi:hypothetical protein